MTEHNHPDDVVRPPSCPACLFVDREMNLKGIERCVPNDDRAHAIIDGHHAPYCCRHEHEAGTLGSWPPAVSNGLSLACSDCGELPRFDYHVSEEFWQRWVSGPERLSVICLPCLDRRCGGVGLGDALQEVQWTGTGHTVVLVPHLRHVYGEPTDATR